MRNGETVKVAVRNGGAQLELEAQAEGSGAVGEIIYVRNPNSHRRFRARVEGAGRVAVDAAGGEPRSRTHETMSGRTFGVRSPCCGAAGGAKKKQAAPSAVQNPLDRYVAESEARSAEAPAATPGSIWQAGSRLADAARDVRASQVDDVLTIVVAEQASAVATGVTKTSRASSTKNSISALAGVTKATGALANLAGRREIPSSPGKAPPAAPPP